uniref:hypothetical protein n=1 Tax=Kluyvera ascorbata TaxID=51288 RepID=UPI0035A687D3
MDRQSGGGIKKFGDYLASPSFKSDVDAFMSGVEKLGRVIQKVFGWATGGESTEELMGGGAPLPEDPSKITF